MPSAITLHQKSRVLEIAFTDGRTFKLPYEFLRVYSPSAEVRGHGPGQELHARVHVAVAGAHQPAHLRQHELLAVGGTHADQLAVRHALA